MRRRPGARGGHRLTLGFRTFMSVIAVTTILTACSDDDDAAPDDTAEPIVTETTDPILIEVTPPLELSASGDPDFISEVLADDAVSDDELADAFSRFIDCLAGGGATGVYAFDPSLRVAYSDWSLLGAAAGSNDQAVLQASCSRDYLGDLIPRFNAANPPDADLADRQRTSVLACIEGVDPSIAAAVPDGVFTADTTGTGLNPDDLQLDPSALGADTGEVDAIQRCLGSFGAETTTFGVD